MSHENESFVDRIKDALGMGTQDHDDHDPHADERADGWAGMDDALSDDALSGPDDALGGPDTRPAGPDYGAGDDDLTGPRVRAGDAWTREEAAAGRPGFDAGTDLDVDPDAAATSRREEDL